MSLSTSGGRARRWNCDWEMEEFGHELMEMQIDDLDCAGNQNSYLVKRSSGGGVRFSKDPLNLVNVHSRKVCPICTNLREDYS